MLRQRRTSAGNSIPTENSTGNSILLPAPAGTGKHSLPHPHAAPGSVSLGMFPGQKRDQDSGPGLVPENVMNVRGSAALWSRLSGREATFLFSLKISVGVQGKYPARWLWNAEECGDHPWAGSEKQWEPLGWECGDHPEAGSEEQRDLLGSERRVWRTQLDRLRTWNAVLAAGIVPWAWIPGEKDELQPWTQRTSHALSHVGWQLWGQGSMVHHTEIASLP